MATKKFKSHRQESIAVAQAEITKEIYQNLAAKLIRANQTMFAVIKHCYQDGRAPTEAEVEACIAEDLTDFLSGPESSSPSA